MIAEEICHRLMCSLCPHMKYSLILLCNGLCSICVSNCTVYSGLCLVLFCLVRYQRWSSWIMVQVCVLASVSCPVLTSQTCAFCAFLYFSFPKCMTCHLWLKLGADRSLLSQVLCVLCRMWMQYFSSGSISFFFFGFKVMLSFSWSSAFV